MDHSLFITAIFRHSALSSINYNITCHKLLSVSFLRETVDSSTYNMRSKSDFVIPLVGKVFKGSSSICYYGPIIWSLVPEEIRSKNSLESFKIKITWKSMDCPSRICKNYIRKVGFLETFE